MTRSLHTHFKSISHAEWIAKDLPPKKVKNAARAVKPATQLKTSKKPKKGITVKKVTLPVIVVSDSDTDGEVEVIRGFRNTSKANGSILGEDSDNDKENVIEENTIGLDDDREEVEKDYYEEEQEESHEPEEEEDDYQDYYEEEEEESHEPEEEEDNYEELVNDMVDMDFGLEKFQMGRADVDSQDEGDFESNSRESRVGLIADGSNLEKLDMIVESEDEMQVPGHIAFDQHDNAARPIGTIYQGAQVLKEDGSLQGTVYHIQSTGPVIPFPPLLPFDVNRFAKTRKNLLTVHIVNSKVVPKRVTESKKVPKLSAEPPNARKMPYDTEGYEKALAGNVKELFQNKFNGRHWCVINDCGKSYTRQTSLLAHQLVCGEATKYCKACGHHIRISLYDNHQVTTHLKGKGARTLAQQASALAEEDVGGKGKKRAEIEIFSDDDEEMDRKVTKKKKKD